VTKRRVGILIAIAGVLACVLVALADPLGLGHDGLGPKKDALLGIGGLLIIIGVVILVRSRHSEPLEEMHHMRG
jgi:drug/metabolite transporter (DMT)-like permease